MDCMLEIYSAHTVVYDVTHNYCRVQIKHCERYGKKAFHCVERSLKYGLNFDFS